MKEIPLTVSFHSHKVQISAYVERRAQEWIVFLHGLQSSKELFAQFMNLPFFKRYSLLALDFVGFGRSSKPASFSYDIKDQARICQDILQSLGIRKFHVIGHSLGGMVGCLLLKPEKPLAFVNMEGNLVFKDCGISKEVASCSFEEFQKKQFSEIKGKIKNSGESSAKRRTKWLKQIPDFAFYKTCVSIVKWSKSGELLRVFLDSPCRKLYIYGDKNSFIAIQVNNQDCKES